MHTNASMAERLGLVHSTVSRIRAGLRLPSVGVMTKIEELFGWKIGDQVAARNKGVYAEQFEKRCMRQRDPRTPADPGVKSKTRVPS